MEPTVGFRFFAIPGHQLLADPESLSADQRLEPDLPPMEEAVEKALASAEFRDVRARDRLRSLLMSDGTPAYASPGPGFGPAAVFARPPQDLPALLRLADELDSLSRREAGERAVVWKCGECSARY